MSVLIECLSAIAGSQHITTDALGGKAVSCVAKRIGLAILNVRKTYGWSTTKPAPKHVSNA